MTGTGAAKSFPPFDDRLMVVVESALRAAWKMVVRTKDSTALRTAQENQITLWVEEALFELRELATKGEGGVPGFDRSTFERVQRGAAVCDYSGKKINKQPDLVFRTVGPRAEGVDAFIDGHVIECKLLDTTSGKNLGLYGSEGVMRFIDGRYGWAMPHAGMLAYVRTSQKLPDDLEAYFRRVGNQDTYKTNGEVSRCRLGGRATPATYLSGHERTFVFDDDVPPGPIALRHLWLEVP